MSTLLVRDENGNTLLKQELCEDGRERPIAHVKADVTAFDDITVTVVFADDGP